MAQKLENVNELEDLTNNIIDDDYEVQNILVSKLNGVEGIPYQFMENVDRRLPDTDIGRMYADKIISRIPLLFLTPCEPIFMDDFNKNDKEVAINFLLDGEESVNNELINGKGRYYSLQHAYNEYYKYLNCMLASVAAFLGNDIFNTQIRINGKKSALGTYNWQNELNDSFKRFFSSAENVIFYLDGMTSVSETYSNDTTTSNIASQINGFSDTANELRFLFGQKGGAIGSLLDSGTEITSSITSSLSGILSKLGGGIVGSLAENGVNTVLNGGKIVFPEIWSNSSSDRSYSIDIKLRSPDHDSLSIFLNVLKPYCRLLALTLPRAMDDNPNGFRRPFMVKAYSKGLFNVEYGIISSMSVTKGAECCWNDDGLPTQIDITLDIKDLYSSLSMSGFTSEKKEGSNIFTTPNMIKHVVNNTSYMDFLANMAGLNIGKMEIGRKIKLYYYLTRTSLKQTPANLFTRFDQSVSRIMGKLYDKLS